MSLVERGPVDVGLVLALLHHLAIGNNVPFPDVAQFFSKITHSLIIEFVPKHDSQVQRLLVTREDIFDSYTQEHFEQAFVQYFTIEAKVAIRDSQRVMYLMKTR